MAKTEMKPENFDPSKIDAFRKMLNGAVEYAQQHNVPICVVEGGLRDILASIDGHRSLNGMRAQGARL